MKRSSKFTTKYMTTKKKILINQLFDLYSTYLQKTIDLLWNEKIALKKNLSSKEIGWMDNLGGQYKQLIYKQASEIVRSCKFKKGNKSKPEIKNFSINFDNRMLTVEKSSNSFDRWIRLKLPFIIEGIRNRRIEILIPLKGHYHSHKFDAWQLVNSVRLSRNAVTLIFEKEEELKQKGIELGLDIGYKKLIVTSEKQEIGNDFYNIYEKISRKKQGSKAFKRVLKERDYKINELINKELDLSKVRTLIVEDLKNVKKNSKGKIRKKFNNKLQRWTYSKILNKLGMFCEDNRVSLVKVNPAYTSQTCTKCRFVHKSNRNGELFKCRKCGYTSDADFNASLNILNRFRLRENMVSVKENKRL